MGEALQPTARLAVVGSARVPVAANGDPGASGRVVVDGDGCSFEGLGVAHGVGEGFADDAETEIGDGRSVGASSGLGHRHRDAEGTDAVGHGMDVVPAMGAVVVWSGCGRVLKASEQGYGAPGLGESFSCHCLDVFQ